MVAFITALRSHDEAIFPFTETFDDLGFEDLQKMLVEITQRIRSKKAVPYTPIFS
jgi:hypothetical protein